MDEENSSSYIKDIYDPARQNTYLKEGPEKAPPNQMEVMVTKEVHVNIHNKEGDSSGS
jgi:ribosomal protein S10